MEKLDLLKKVLTDYCAQNEEYRFQEGLLAAFCDYAAKWLRENGVIGIGHTAEGLSLRMANGAEYMLFQPESSVNVTPPVSITGVTTKIEKAVNDTTRSFPITGR